ncbi:hypothetical protein Cgig2_010180 [Carnegiea gigantea]|uniref:DUF4283 domain-containing protein n=1 Tax=Carnegiea gigantea TaxID=171969 RepID=A0A9Q1GN76_9CARY|nr:hypothetical protein Cgig2_010180 [Carnegiea gigantea]
MARGGKRGRLRRNPVNTQPEISHHIQSYDIPSAQNGLPSPRTSGKQDNQDEALNPTEELNSNRQATQQLGQLFHSSNKQFESHTNLEATSPGEGSPFLICNWPHLQSIRAGSKSQEGHGSVASPTPQAMAAGSAINLDDAQAVSTERPQQTNPQMISAINQTVTGNLNQTPGTEAPQVDSHQHQNVFNTGSQVTTYASLINPKMGNNLKFIPTDLVNGNVCAKLETEDVLTEIEYWSSSVLCSVIGSNPPFEIIQNYIRKIWAHYEIDKILQVRKGLFLARFVHHQNKTTVESKGFYFFGNKPFVVKGWNLELEMHTGNLKSIPLWIRLPNLELKYWSISSLSKIGSLIGIPIKTDQYTISKTMIQYARLLIEVPIEGPFPDYVDFFNEKGQLIRQQVQFDWKPTKCTHCHMLGHTNDICKKKKEIRKEWRLIVQGVSTTQNIPSTLPQRETPVRQNSLPSSSAQDQGIHKELSTNKHFYLSMIYGLNHEQQRESLWNDLMDISSSIDRAWCLMGDFNTLRFKEDRIGGNEVQDSDIRELATHLDACEIHDLKSSGAYYSWTNKMIWSRIDHVFLNDLWYDSFDYTHSSYLPNSLSDHTPILLQFPSLPRPPSVFQYCDMWSKHKEFNNIILSHKDVVTRSLMLSLCGLLKRLRHPLRSLHRDNFSDLKNQQVRARNTLESLQKLHHQHPNNNSMAHQEKEYRPNQAARKKENGSSTEMTVLDFSMPKPSKENSSYIYTLKDQEGKIMEGFEEVGQAMFKFYKDMLGEQPTVRSHIDMDVIAQGKILSSEQQVSICRPFTNKDIKEALWSISNHKSPSPDGYSSGFFKSTWDQTGHLVCDAVQDFFQYTSLPKEISDTKLVVIPKVQHPQYAHEFYPISCYNVIYKCITKLLG